MRELCGGLWPLGVLEFGGVHVGQRRRCGRICLVLYACVCVWGGGLGVSCWIEIGILRLVRARRRQGAGGGGWLDWRRCAVRSGHVLAAEINGDIR